MSPAHELFVPGRLCLFGEHSDWAAGYRAHHPEIPPGLCLVSGTDQGLFAEARAADSLSLTSRLPSGEEIGPARIAATPGELSAAAAGADFFSYAAGVAHELVESHGVGGLELSIRADLPVRKGLSSSAAVAVLVARAYSQVYGLGLTPRAEMELAYAGERRTGSECGRMDQVCAFGRSVTCLRFDGEALDVEVLRAGGPLALLVVDLRRGKDTRRILSDLNACFPDSQDPVAAGVRDALGLANLELVGRAREALEAGSAAALGACMSEAQRLFDEKVAPASPELRAPRLHEVLDHPAVRECAYGAKGVGSQGDGSAQILARDPDAREHLSAVLERELGVRCLPLSIEPDDQA